MSVPIFVVISIVLLLLFAAVALRRHRDLGDVDQAVQAIRSLDIEAFRNLMDPEEGSYLREHLPEPLLREVRRERSQAALLYMKELSVAALRFARLGDAARRSSDPVVAAWGKQIADSAIYLRLQTLEMRVRLRASLTFPSLQPHRLRPLLDLYDRANTLAFQRNAVRGVQRQAS